MPLPGVYDLVLYRGDTYEWRFQFWADEARTQAIDLTDAVPKAEIRARSGALPVTTLYTAVGIPNIVYMGLLVAAWETIPPTGGVWDLQITFPDGDVHTPVRGAVTVCADVTDSVAAAPGRRLRR